ncbi:MAG: hypothetical protein QOG64_1292, partial [Acidimicrobiaceae bacterium]|nr:hypothetical protein [Acidimicrobiaceae bacterium]
GVISYRLVNFWLHIPAGGAAYHSQPLGRGSTTQRKTEELSRLAEEARRDARAPRLTGGMYRTDLPE